jgi:UDP:flavonoid glycosyltransferase YjiC (YdhE family)
MVVFATFGSLGDLHPFIAVGRALLERGVGVRIATAAEYQAAVEGAGLEFAPVRPSIAALGDPEEVARRLFDPLRGTQRLIRDIVMPHLREAHADLTLAARDADLLVSHSLTYTLQVVAHQRGLPWISVVLAPISLLSRHDPPALPGPNLLRVAHRLGPLAYEFVTGLMRGAVRRWEAPLHELRRELGLPQTRQIMTFEGQFSPRGTLALFDPMLEAPQSDWPPHTCVCGAALHEGGAADPVVTGELQRFLDQGTPPLVFALGSAAVYVARNYWREAIAASVKLGRRAILITGKPLEHPLPPDIRAFDYLPYSMVFPHAAAIIHQAGIGTLSQAMRAGRPQLLTPVGFDQHDNARRTAALGVGRVLPFRRASAARLARELDAVLKDTASAMAARDLAARLRPVDGAAAAAGRIVALLSA